MPPMRFGVVAFPPMADEAASETSSGDLARLTTFSGCLYRGGYPKPRNLRFLETLHIRTIVSLTPKPIEDDPMLAAWAQNQHGGVGFRIVHVRTEKPKEEMGGLTREGAARAMLELLNRENMPMYVHCLDGMEATSTLVACLRKIQGWNDASWRQELGRGLHVASNRLSSSLFEVPSHLAHFVDRYGEPDGVLLPQRDRIPSWLWPSSDVTHQPAWRSEANPVDHPSLRIHFERSEFYLASHHARTGAVWSAVPGPRSRTPSTLSSSEASDASPHDFGSGMGTSPRGSEAGSTDSYGAGDDCSGGNADLTVPSFAETHELRTPRARPLAVHDDVPPLGAWDERGRGQHMHSHVTPMGLTDTERTPQVLAKDAALADTPDEPSPSVPPLGLDTEGDDDYDLDAEDDDDEDPSQVLDALDLDGF